MIRNAIDEMNKGFCGVSFHDITDSLLNQDPYMVLADFESYAQAQNRAVELFKDQEPLEPDGPGHISKAGRFAADRSIRDYADNIWHATPVPPAPPVDKTVKTAVKKSLSSRKCAKSDREFASHFPTNSRIKNGFRPPPGASRRWHKSCAQLL